tara:strand:- start:220 stop:1137 length:918 start_codon:yes stop_codon:yes gene_type:complete
MDNYLGAETSQNEPAIFHCKHCHYTTSKIGNWKRHLKTRKHMDNKWITMDNKKDENEPDTMFTCECGKSYKYKSGLCKHKKKCTYVNVDGEMSDCEEHTKIVVKEKLSKEEMLLCIIEKQQKQIDQLLAPVTGVCEAMKDGKLGNTTNNNIGTQNNIMVYLNENCSNAMSIQDFVGKLSMTINDLQSLKDDKPLAIVDIVRKNLAPLSLTDRPIHSTSDSAWFIKDKEDGWQEDDGEKIVKNAEHGVNKEWANVYAQNDPNWENNEKAQDEYCKISLAATSEMNKKSKRKLKKKLAKVCLLPKEQ